VNRSAAPTTIVVTTGAKIDTETIVATGIGTTDMLGAMIDLPSVGIVPVHLLRVVTRMTVVLPDRRL
jgi:hypothetical protein